MRSPKVVVIGAGPGGSTAARQLALRGARVTLLEARRLPRDKACAGALTPKARQLLPEGVLESATCTVHRFEFQGGRLPPFRLDEPAAEISMVRRSAFDYAMAEAAAAAGVDVCDGEPVVGIVEDDDGVTVRTRRSKVTADYAIGADGCPSRVARELGLGGGPYRRSLALSGEVPLSRTLPPALAVISFSVAHGYAWYFPKGEHASVGVGALIAADRKRRSVDSMRDALAELASRADFDIERARLTGHLVPHGIGPGPLVTRRCMLVGDAAGTADPLMGEGIAYAIGSGWLAARALLDVVTARAADLTPYEHRIRATYGRAMQRLRFAARVVDHAPTLALASARLSPWIRAYGVNVVAGLRAPFAFVLPEDGSTLSSTTVSS